MSLAASWRPMGATPLDAARAEIDRGTIRDVGWGPHRNDSRGRPCRRCVDGDHEAVRDRRARKPHVQLMRKRDVPCETAAATHQGRVLKPRYGSAAIGFHWPHYIAPRYNWSSLSRASPPRALVSPISA